MTRAAQARGRRRPQYWARESGRRCIVCASQADFAALRGDHEQADLLAAGAERAGLAVGARPSWPPCRCPGHGRARYARAVLTTESVGLMGKTGSFRICLRYQLITPTPTAPATAISEPCIEYASLADL